MKHGWTDIVAQAGNEDVGQMLVRLAKLAVAVHQAESAERLRRQYAGVGDAALPQQVRPCRPVGRTGEVVR